MADKQFESSVKKSNSSGGNNWFAGVQRGLANQAEKARIAQEAKEAPGSRVTGALTSKEVGAPEWQAGQNCRMVQPEVGHDPFLKGFMHTCETSLRQALE